MVTDFPSKSLQTLLISSMHPSGVHATNNGSCPFNANSRNNNKLNINYSQH
jgi:hypothetical protein